MIHIKKEKLKKWIKCIILTIFQVRGLWHLVHSHRCTAVTSIPLQDVSPSPPETPYPFNSNSSLFLLPASGVYHHPYTFCSSDTLSECNYAIFVLLGLAYLTLHNVFKFHPHYNAYHNVLSFFLKAHLFIFVWLWWVFVAVCGLLLALASLVEEHRLQAWGLP